MKNERYIPILILLGVLGSILVGIGEYLLHYLPEDPGGEVSMLEHVPLTRAIKGHFFVVFSTPLYFTVYYGLRDFFKKTRPILANTIFILGVLAFSIGGVWVSSRYFGAEVLQRSQGTANHAFYLQSYEDHYQTLVWALHIIVALLSTVYVTLILKNNQGLPKWLAIFNSIVLLIIIISSLFWFKPLGVQIAPIAMNITLLIFYSLILFQVKKQYWSNSRLTEF